MRILFVSAEVAPFAKVGGLADVAGSLPKALQKLGHDVRVLMPDYSMIEASGRFQIATINPNVDLPINPAWTEPLSIRQTSAGDVPIYLAGSPNFFHGVDRSENIYLPGIEQYLFLSEAALKLPHILDWQPELIHCHDWQTGFIPVLMREKYGDRFEDVASVFTIHNLAYQGEFDLDVLDKFDLPRSLFNQHQVEAWGRVNFLKAGTTYADEVNTVSDNYAREILTPNYGAGLDGLMRHLDSLGKLHGIVNGIDQEAFNPGTDPDLPAHFSAADLSGKTQCRAALLAELGMEAIPGAPLLGVVSRMSSQKGMDLIAETSGELFDLPVQIVILGAGEQGIVDSLNRLQAKSPGHLRFIDGFNLALGARIYAGCDAFLMPSAFEPCGLGQMIAMRYGTVPLVRATGGLADTVHEGRNGFVFEQRSAGEFISGVHRLASAFRKPKTWQKLVAGALACDFSWEKSAVQYEELYEQALRDRSARALQMA